MTQYSKLVPVGTVLYTAPPAPESRKPAIDAAAIRAAALEEAATVCDLYSKANMENDNMTYAFDHCTAAIRALKEQKDVK